MKTEVTTKEKIFQTVTRLFYQYGYRAIGEDTIAAESGIGKMTLYRHYPSKDDLIVAYLRDSNQDFWDQFEQITKDAPTAGEKLLAFFESLKSYVLSPDCYGCPFINVAAKYRESDYAWHRVALEHKQSVLARFRQLSEEAGARQPDALANALILLMDGAYVAARMFGPSTDSPAISLAVTARYVIQANC